MPSLKFSASDPKKYLCKHFSPFIFLFLNRLAFKEDYENDSKSLGICFLCCLLNENSDVSQLNRQILNNSLSNIAMKFYMELRNWMGSI